jgi:hypothetical protein
VQLAHKELKEFREFRELLVQLDYVVKRVPQALQGT